MTQAVGTLDMAEAKAFQIRRWAISIREQVETIDDPDTLQEIAASLVGARHRLRQLGEEVVEAERTRVLVVQRIGQLLPVTDGGGRPEGGSLPAAVTAIPRSLRHQARTLADNPTIVEAALKRERPTVNAIVKSIVRQHGAARIVAEAERAADRAVTLSIQPGQTWMLGDHRLYCGEPSAPAFHDMVRVAEPVFAFCDPPWGREWDLDWLADRVSVVAVLAYIDTLPALFATTKMNYQWIISVTTYDGSECPLGTNDWQPVVLYGNGSIHRELSDYARVRTDATVLRDNRKSLGLPLRLIEVFTSTGDVIVDPLAGSVGLSILAAERLGRRCIAAEADPLKCATIIGHYANVGTAPRLLS